jgi:hypothetical protein
MTCWLDEVDAGVYAVIDQLQPVDPILLLQVGVEAGLDIVDDWLPANGSHSARGAGRFWIAHLSSLFTKSPKPGVSTTVNLKRTPFSSMSITGISLGPE